MMKNHDNDDHGAVAIENVNFNDIIKERKGRRKLDAKERRQVDLQRIVDMKSSTGINPLHRFPEEIWSKIFDELDPDDRSNVWHVHPMFRDIMESRRIRDILLPQVLKVGRFERYVEDTDYNEILQDYNYEQLRSVSKAIRNSFDRLTEELVLQRIRESEASWVFGGAVSISLGSISERLLLKRLLSSFQSDQKNPGKRYFPRDLCICLEDSNVENEDGEDVSEIINEFKTNLFSLLGVIGDQILHLKFEFDNSDTDIVEFSPTRFYIVFQQLISLMPNLRWLEVMIQTNKALPEEVGVEATLLRHPFPRLASLERLTFIGSFYNPCGVDGLNFYCPIMEANPHLQMLDLDERNGVHLRNLPVDLIKALPLTSFRSCAPDEDFDAITLENIEEVVNFNWPLQTIDLKLDYWEALKSLVPLLQFLEKFPTLETVKLKELKGFKFGKEDAFEYLKLPNLKNLEVVLSYPYIRLEGNIHFFFSLQFLLQCEKLKTLKWNMRLDEEEDTELRKYLKKHENGKTVDFRAGMTVLYESNIWDIFPYLDIVKVEIKKDPINACCRRFPLMCEQEYRRSSRRGMSFRKFLKNHGCSSRNSLQNCVVLHE